MCERRRFLIVIMIISATINTDASFCPETKAAGCAFWISSSLGKVTGSSILKNAKNPQDAETQAIANALHVLSTNPNYRGLRFDRLWINSDCTGALDRIERKSEDTPAEKCIQDTLSRVLSKDGTLTCLHVKAHKFTGSARSFVNHWCDRAAKKCMREERFSRSGKLDTEAVYYSHNKPLPDLTNNWLDKM